MAPVGMKKGLSFGTLMQVGYEHDDEGTSEISKKSVQNVIEKVQSSFSGALTAHVLAFQLKDLLAHHGFTASTTHLGTSTTLLGTSLCCDDVCRDLEDELRAQFDQNQNIGGLAGFCFGGATAFGDMLHHVPESGNCIFVYGPHVGIDWDGNIGKVNRRGQNGSAACCACANIAATYVKMVRAGKIADADIPDGIVDGQQTWVQKEVLKHAERLEKATDPNVELPHVLFDCQNDLINKIVAKACGQIKGQGKIALVGGILINTPEGTAEYFLPKRFDLVNNKGEIVEDLLVDFHNSMANTATW